MITLNPQDLQLIQLATEKVTKFFSPKHHRLATTMLTSDGKVITGVNVEGSFGCNDICAEQVTLGMALSSQHKNIDTIVTVKHPKPEDIDQRVRVANPCGKCRELLLDYVPEAWVIMREGDVLMKIKAKDLIPYRYSK